MDFITAVKAVAELGVLVVCAGVVIWQTINDRINQQKSEEALSEKNKETIEALRRQNEAMFNQIMQKVDTGHIISQEEDRNIFNIEKEIEEYLNEILTEIGANRVSLFRYHNGGKDYNGISFLRMSMTNEVVKRGTALIQPQCQNLFRSMFFNLIHSLEKNGYSYIKNIEDIKENDAGFYTYLNDYGIASKCSFALYNSEERVIGFISADFYNPDDVNIELIDKCFNDKKIKVETLLNL